MPKTLQNHKFQSLSVKTVCFILLVVMLSSFTVGGIGFVINRNTVVEQSKQRALTVCHSVVSALDIAQYQEMISSQTETEYYKTYKNFLDKVFEETGVTFLYILQNRYDAENVYYFAEGYKLVPEPDYESAGLGFAESIGEHNPELFQTLEDGSCRVTAIYKTDSFGSLLSAYVPIFNTDGRTVIGVVGVDIGIETIQKSAIQFSVYIAIYVLVLCVAAGLLVIWYVQRYVGKPVMKLTAAVEQIAVGDINVDLFQAKKSDEIGNLAQSFHKIVDSAGEQIRALSALAVGDLSIPVSPRSPQDKLNLELHNLIEQLNRIFSDFKLGIAEISQSSDEMASGASALAKDSTAQAAAVEQLSLTTQEVSANTQETAHMAEQSATLAISVRDKAKNGLAQMESMNKAVKEIHESGQSISGIIKTIHDIAFQTNILALNAAVEAARAGQEGQGFAVVAKEVRALAQRSAQAAQETEALILNSLKKTVLGVSLSDDTYHSLSNILADIQESSRISEQIARSAEEQSLAISQITQGITQVAAVAQRNSGIAEQSAAACQEISEQAASLLFSFSKFQLME